MIKKITFEDTYPIRHQVMWPNEAVEYIQLEDDENGLHYGYFLGDQLVAVISLFVRDKAMQFRKFACLVEHQGKGYGTALLNYVIDLYLRKDIERIWCHARIEKTYFYERFGLEKTENTFEKKGQKYVVMVLHTKKST